MQDFGGWKGLWRTCHCMLGRNVACSMSVAKVDIHLLLKKGLCDTLINQSCCSHSGSKDQLVTPWYMKVCDSKHKMYKQ